MTNPTSSTKTATWAWVLRMHLLEQSLVKAFEQKLWVSILGGEQRRVWRANRQLPQSFQPISRVLGVLQEALRRQNISAPSNHGETAHTHAENLSTSHRLERSPWYQHVRTLNYKSKYRCLMKDQRHRFELPQKSLLLLEPGNESSVLVFA